LEKGRKGKGDFKKKQRGKKKKKESQRQEEDDWGVKKKTETVQLCFVSGVREQTEAKKKKKKKINPRGVVKRREREKRKKKGKKEAWKKKKGKPREGEIIIKHTRLEECAFALGLAARLGDRGVEDSTDSLIKDDLETLLGEGRALEVLVGVDLTGLLLTLLDRDGAALVLLAQLLLGVVIVTEIELCADKDDGDLGTVVAHLGVPL